MFGFGVWGIMQLLFFHSKAKTKGMDTKVDIGIKYADKQTRSFDDEKLKAGQCVIGLQVRNALCVVALGNLLKPFFFLGCLQ